jgi:hypothetical protein
MNPWTSKSIVETTTTAAYLLSLTYELHLKLKERSSDMEPDEAIALLGQIASLATSMRNTAEMAKVRALLQAKHPFK